MATCNANSLLASGVQFQSVIGGLAPAVRLALLKRMLLAVNPSADTSVNSMLRSGVCFTCLTTEQRKIVKLQLLCNIKNAAGGSVPMPTDMILWLNPDTITGLNPGDDINAWADSSGHGNNAISFGDAAPTWDPNFSNGHGSPRWPDNSLRGFFIGSSLYSGNDPRTLFVVWKKTAVGGTGALAGTGLEANNEFSMLMSRTDVNGGNCSPYHASFFTDTFGTDLNSNNVIYADAVRTTASVVEVWRNGSLKKSANLVLATSPNSFTVGLDGDTSFPFDFGYIPEVIAWNRTLTDGEMGAVFNYLSNKFAF